SSNRPCWWNERPSNPTLVKPFRLHHTPAMTLRLFVMGGLLVMAAALQAAPSKLDTLTVGSKTFTNVTVLGSSATDLYFTHGAGIGNVKLKYLSADLQKQFNFDA